LADQSKKLSGLQPPMAIDRVERARQHRLDAEARDWDRVLTVDFLSADDRRLQRLEQTNRQLQEVLATQGMKSGLLNP
jgi:hypothetical protein